MKALVKGLVISAALLVAGQAQAATELTYVFQARGAGTMITGYGNQGPITSAFSGATIRFVVSVVDGANVGSVMPIHRSSCRRTIRASASGSSRSATACPATAGRAWPAASSTGSSPWRGR